MVGMAQTSIGYRYSLDQLDRLKRIDSNFVIESLLGYQIGLSRSIWLYSPVLLLGIWGDKVDQHGRTLISLTRGALEELR